MEVIQDTEQCLHDENAVDAGNDDSENQLTNLEYDTKVSENLTDGEPEPMYDADQYVSEVKSETQLSTDEEMQDDDNDTELSPELQQGLRILTELTADSNKSVNWPFLDPVDSNHPETADYYERIKNPMWFGKMKEKFDSRSYKTITGFVSDFRLMLENCYRYNGPDHYVSKRGQKLETMMEQKLALLSRELREKTCISATSGQSSEDHVSGLGLRRRTRTIIPHDSSVLLNQLREEELQREREARKQQMTDRKAAQEAALQDIMDWEDGIMEGKRDQLRAMWEVPQIGHFLFLCQEHLNVGEITQFELERCFFIPKVSSTMQKLMTTLLSTPFQRLKIDKRTMMPYNVWNEKLRNKLRLWYKAFTDEHENANKAADKFGIDPRFYTIVGRKNPLERRKFHEIGFYRRVWIVKSLCDYCLETQEAVRESLECQPIEEQHDYLVGVDAEGNRYLHFPQFCGADLRIYRQSKIPEPKIEIPPRVESPQPEEQEEVSQEKLKEEEKKDKTRSAKKKKRKLKSDIPAPPTNRPSRLRQTIKTVIPVQTLSTSDEDNSDSDLSDVNCLENQTDLNENSNGSSSKKPFRKLRNRKVSRLIENDNQSDTSSMDGDLSWKRKPTSRLVRNGLMRELKNVSEISMDESSMDKDETLSEKSFAQDTDSCNVDDSNLGSSEQKGDCVNGKVSTDFLKCVKDLEKKSEEMDDDSIEEDTNSDKTKEFFKGLANTNIERELSPFENDIDYDSPCTEGFEADDIEMNSLFNDVTASDECEVGKDGVDERGDSDSTSIKGENQDTVVESKKTAESNCDISCDSTESSHEKTNCDDSKSTSDLEISKIKQEIQSDSANQNSEDTNKAAATNVEDKSELKTLQLKHESVDEVHQSGDDNLLKKSEQVSTEKLSIKKEYDDTSSLDLKPEKINPDPCEEHASVSKESSCDKPEVDVKTETQSTSHDHDYIQDVKEEPQERKLDHDYGQGCCADIGSVKKEDGTEVEMKEEEEEEEEEEEISPDLEEFELIVESVEDLRNLVERFAEQEPVVIGRGKKQKVIKPPARKKCVVELHGRLLFLLKELEPWEQKLISATKKARLKIRKEHISYEESLDQEKWELDKADDEDKDDSESDEDNSGSEESEDEPEKTATIIGETSSGDLIIKTEPMEDSQDFDVSSRGRIRKRRVIPNNSEDQGSAKKKKIIPTTTSSISIPHVPNILQRPGKVNPEGASPGQIVIQGATSTAGVRLLSGSSLIQTQQCASLLQKTAQQSQVTLSSKQASHPVIQQLLSNRLPTPSTSQNVYQQATPLKSNTSLTTAQVNSQKIVIPQQLQTVRPAGSNQQGKVQYYAANINSLPPAVVQQLIKSNALKFPAGSNQSGMVFLTTVSPQRNQGQQPTAVGTQDNSTVRNKVPQQPSLLQLPLATGGIKVALTQSPVSQQPIIATGSHSVISTAETVLVSSSAVPATNVLSGFNVAVNPLLTRTPIISSPSCTSVLSDNTQLASINHEANSTFSVLGSNKVAGVLTTPSQNKVAQKYANNVTVKTLLESRKPPVSDHSVILENIKSSTKSVSSVDPINCIDGKPRTTSVVQNAPKGIKTVKVPFQTMIDLAVTSVKTSLPTVNIKVPSPTTMPSMTPRKNVTKTIQSMKAPIPTTPKVQSISASSNANSVISPTNSGISSVNMTSSPSLTSMIPNQNILLQSGAGGQILLANINKSLLGNVALNNTVHQQQQQQQQDQGQKNAMLKFLPQNVQSSQGVVQGYLTPQGLIIPQAALQQQQQASMVQSVTPQLLTQQAVLQQYSITPPKVNTSQISPAAGTQYMLSQPVVQEPSIQSGQKLVLTKPVVSMVNNSTVTSVHNSLISNLSVNSDNVSSSLNTKHLPVGSTTHLKLPATPQVVVSKTETIPPKAPEGASTNLVNLGNLSKLNSVSSFYLPTVNMLNLENQGKNSANLQQGLSTGAITTTSKPLTGSVAGYGGQIYPIVAQAGAQITNLNTSSSALGSIAAVGQTNTTLIPQSPTMNVPQSPVQLASPLLGQLSNSVANVGNIATMLGQLPNVTKTANVLGQTGLNGNIQLLTQPGATANTNQILGIQNQVTVPVTSNVMSQQINQINLAAGTANLGQVIGQQIVSPVAKQTPSLVLGNINQGSSSDLMKQLAAAQLLGSSQIQAPGSSSGAITTNAITSASGFVQQLNSTGGLQNQMIVQLPTSPQNSQNIVKPQQSGQAMLLLSPQKRVLTGNVGTGATPAKQLTLRLNTPTTVQQVLGTMGLNPAANKLVTQAEGQPKVHTNLATKQLKVNTTPVLQQSVVASTGTDPVISVVNPMQQNMVTTVSSLQKPSATFAGMTTVSASKQILNKADTQVASSEKASQKLYLYNINGQLFTPQGVPVTVENGVLKVLPQSKPVVVEKGVLKVLNADSDKASPGTSMLGTSSQSELPRVKIVYPPSTIGKTSNTVTHSTTISSQPVETGVTPQKRIIISPSYPQMGVSQPQYLMSTSSALSTSFNLSNSVPPATITGDFKGVQNSESVIGIHKVNASKISEQPAVHTSQGNASIASTVDHLGVQKASAQVVPNVSTVSQVNVGGHLKINQILAQQGSAPSSVVISSSPSVATATKKIVSPQMLVQNRPRVPSLQTGTAGQGYIVMPNAAGQTQIIFPQANLNTLKGSAASGLLSNPSILSNVKLVKAADMAKNLSAVNANVGGGTQLNANSSVLSGGATKVVFHSAQNTGDKSSLKVVQPLDVATKNTGVNLENKEVNSTMATNQVLKYSINVPSSNVNEEKSVAESSTIVKSVSSVNSDIPNGLSVVSQAVAGSGGTNNTDKVTSNGFASQTEPKGAEKEEAALNLLSLANQAF